MQRFAALLKSQFHAVLIINRFVSDCHCYFLRDSLFCGSVLLYYRYSSRGTGMKAAFNGAREDAPRAAMGFTKKLSWADACDYVSASPFACAVRLAQGSRFCLREARTLGTTGFPVCSASSTAQGCSANVITQARPFAFCEAPSPALRGCITERSRRLAIPRA